MKFLGGTRAQPVIEDWRQSLISSAAFLHKTDDNHHLGYTTMVAVQDYQNVFS
jgi:hypothetical protein